MSDIERLRKLAGIKEKPVLTEIQPPKKNSLTESNDSKTVVYMSVVKEKEGTYAWVALLKGSKGSARQGGFYSKEEAKAAGEKQKFKGNPTKVWPKSVKESTDEYDVDLPVDTFGQIKAPTMEPDFPVDMGEEFSKTETGASNDAIGDGEEGFGDDSETDADTTEDESEEESEETENDYESSEDEDFSKKVAEAADFFKIKTFVRNKLNESIPEHTGSLYRNKKNKLLYKLEKVSPRSYTGSWYEATPYKHSTELAKKVKLEDFTKVSESKDFGNIFLSASRVLSEHAETLIVNYGANLTPSEENKIAMAVAKDVSEGVKSVLEAAEIHGVRGIQKGKNLTFEFTDTASALMFTNYLAENCDCVSHVRITRGIVEATVRDFLAPVKKAAKKLGHKLTPQASYEFMKNELNKRGFELDANRGLSLLAHYYTKPGVGSFCIGNLSLDKPYGSVFDMEFKVYDARNKFLGNGWRKEDFLSWLDKLAPITESNLKIGDNVHLGLKVKGGAGFNGKVKSIDGDQVEIESPEKTKWGTKTYKGSLKNVSSINEGVDPHSRGEALNAVGSKFNGQPIEIEPQEFQQLVKQNPTAKQYSFQDIAGPYEWIGQLFGAQDKMTIYQVPGAVVFGSIMSKDSGGDDYYFKILSARAPSMRAKLKKMFGR